MRKFAELGTVHRIEPCVEYPGTWLLTLGGEQESKHRSLKEAKEAGQALRKQGRQESIDIYWDCSDNDPRIGETWFSGFYRHCIVDEYGHCTDM